MKTHIHSTKVFVFCALPCEAKPLIDQFKLKKDTSVHAFDLFRGGGMALTVTGIGKAAVAAGVAYTLALSAKTAHPVLINVGIAGHKTQQIGRLFLIDKISDADTQKHYYPPIIFNPPCPTLSLQTLSRPQAHYPATDLLDMEGSAFYETATRFSTGELIQSLKIISDNEESPVDRIKPAFVTALIAAQITALSELIHTLTQLADALPPADLPDNQDLLNHYHFTVNQQMQLKKLLQRHRLTGGKQPLDYHHCPAKNAQDYLRHLEQLLNKADFNL